MNKNKKPFLCRLGIHPSTIRHTESRTWGNILGTKTVTISWTWYECKNCDYKIGFKTEEEARQLAEIRWAKEENL